MQYVKHIGGLFLSLKSFYQDRMKDYYYILGLNETATTEEVKKAYRKLSLKFHPDKNDGDEFFTERFKEIQEAYETLVDSSKRKAYDYSRNANSSAKFSNKGDNFNPEIEYFKTNKSTFQYDEEVTFSWKTINADKVSIKPFGIVQPIGQKTYRIKDFKNATVRFELTAENTNIGRQVKSNLSLINQTYEDLYKDFKEKIVDNEKVFNKDTKVQGKDKERPPYFHIALLLTIFALGVFVLWPWEAEKTKKSESDLPQVIQYLERDMVKVEGGIFVMGCTDEQGSDCESNEKPWQVVTLSSFNIGKYEVTQAQFAAFIEATGYRTDAEKEGWSSVWTGKNNGVSWRNNSSGNGTQPITHPVIHVSWNDAIAFCNWLSEITGKSYRLPTEAEWEYAARGGNYSHNYKFSGSNSQNNVAWYRDNSGLTTNPVGQKQANELGLYDMSGNVWEWCSDWYVENYYSDNPSSNPGGPLSGSERVLRGGGWYTDATYCRVAYRFSNPPDYRNFNFGFRLVLSQ